MRIMNLFLLLIAVTTFTSGCNSTPPSPSKGKMISDCMSAGGSPEECDKKYN